MGADEGAGWPLGLLVTLVAGAVTTALRNRARHRRSPEVAALERGTADPLAVIRAYTDRKERLMRRGCRTLIAVALIATAAVAGAVLAGSHPEAHAPTGPPITAAHPPPAPPVPGCGPRLLG